ncbi:MAG: hypothetical protein JXR96_22185 [Deltaproteobacteria bacterium]|nr:hypothetical protein [Deltaproteobacteria bacterium]
MNVRIHWFGMSWFAACLAAAAAAVFLIVVARRLKARGQGRAAAGLTAAAAIEAAAVALDLVIRAAASHVPEAGYALLDAWTIARPLAHGAVLLLVALAVRGLARPAGEV